MKVGEKWTEQKNGGNTNHKYGIIGFKQHLPSAVAAYFAGVIFFVLLMCWFFENKRQTKMKLKVSVLKTEKNNCGNAHLKYSIRGFDRHLTYDAAVDVATVFLAVDVLVVLK